MSQKLHGKMIVVWLMMISPSLSHHFRVWMWMRTTSIIEEATGTMDDGRSSSEKMVDVGCSMPVVSYLSFALIAANTLVNAVNLVVANNNDQNNSNNNNNLNANTKGRRRRRTMRRKKRSRSRDGFYRLGLNARRIWSDWLTLVSL